MKIGSLLRRIHPYYIIIFTFIGAILFGTLFLALPISTTTGKSLGFVDAFFMSTSSVCVTGLSVINVAYELSVFGKLVMVVLMEVGGLSFITIAVFFFVVIGGKLGVSNKFLLREALNQSSLNENGTLVVKIIVISVIIQLVGAGINMIPIMKIYDNDFWRAFGASLFHSAASFNNAGFDVFGPTSLIEYKDDIILNTTTIFMIVLGGIGFIVIDDVLRNRRWSRFKLHTKITLCTTIILIVLGTGLLKLTSDMSFLQSLFTSVTARTAGFTTYDMSNLKEHPAAYVIIILLMVIGASSCSTGGGIKTSTFAIVMLSIFYFARGKEVRAFKRKIPRDQIFKAFVLVTAVVAILLLGIFFMSVFQPDLVEYGFGIQDIIFEVVSGFSTTGLSMGITPYLNSANRILLCVLMLTGRIGPLTVIGVINKNWLAATKEEIQYVEENVIIG